MDHVKAGKKKEGLIIVLSNGGCGGNIVVSTGKGGKKGGGGHKILVKGGQSGGCGCGHGHEESSEVVPIPMPMPMHHGHRMMGDPMHAGTHHMPVFAPPGMHSSSSENDHEASGSSPEASHGDTGSDDSKSEDSKSNKANENNVPSNGHQNPNVVAPLFVPQYAVPPPWWTQGSPVFVDPSANGAPSNGFQPHQHQAPGQHQPGSIQQASPVPFGMSSFMDGKDPQGFGGNNPQPSFGHPEGYQDMAWAGTSDEHQVRHLTVPSPTSSPAEMKNNDQLKQMAFDWNNFAMNPSFAMDMAQINGSDPFNGIQFPLPSSMPTSATQTEAEQTRAPGRNYIQPFLSSVQKFTKNLRPPPMPSLSALEQGLAKQGQRITSGVKEAYSMMSPSHIIPVVVNYTSNLPITMPRLPSVSLPSLSNLPSIPMPSIPRPNLPAVNLTALWRGLESNRSRNSISIPPGSKYLNNIRTRIRPVALSISGIHMTPILENILKNVRKMRSPNQRGRRRGVKRNQDGSPTNDAMMQQYLETILSSKWWEWPSGSLIGPNLNQYG
ncbi:uncharacterized protein LOC141852592 isoform X2 [Brevipalpus obovatus]|uniref:uncharacterized protein LOC141852592 isoform X2 n=1 Tax=Brevipalpus obovatus TaxID=246614 RepID=UPI003D9EFE3E